MSINDEEYARLIEEEQADELNNDIIKQTPTLNKIKKFNIANIVISSILLIIIILMTIEYNIILTNFNGFRGMESFINKTTVLVNNISPLTEHINKTEVDLYLGKVKFLIDTACETMHCP
jgi:hypothetical protein